MEIFIELYFFRLKELRNYDRKLFLCPPQKRQKHNQDSKLLFFDINLPFGRSD